MNNLTIKSSFVYRLVLSLLLVFAVACSDKEEIAVEDIPEFETEVYTQETKDALTVVSDLPAYVFPHEYDGFGAALVRRLTNQVTENSNVTYEKLATVVIHSSDIATLDDDFSFLLMQLATGQNIIIIEPTYEEFIDFCDEITSTYLELLEMEEEGDDLLDDIEFMPGVRQTFEGFYEMSNDESKIESMFLFDTDPEGVFAEAIAIRGCNFHIVDRMTGVTELQTTHEHREEEGSELVPSEAPKVELPDNYTPTTKGISDYSYGLFADMFTQWINEQEVYMEEMKEMRSRGAAIMNSRSETTKLSLDDITTVQKVDYTISAPTPYNVSNPLPVKVSFEVCSIYMKEHNSDYYCIYKNIISYNQLLNCGPTEKRKWRTIDNFGCKVARSIGTAIYFEWVPYPFYGPFMRDIKCESLCHEHTNKFTDDNNTAVDIPASEKINRLTNANIEKYSPKNSIGSTDKTEGFSYGFDGGLYIAKEPSVNLGFSVSWDTSNTQTINDLEITASSIDGIAKWDYIGHNLPDAFFNLVKTNSHSEAPSIMRVECPVDQSWIWKVSNPTDSYRLYDETSITTSIMYYDMGFAKCNSKFVNNETIKRVSFHMVPPPRSEQIWMMNVKPNDVQGKLEEKIQKIHPRFWNKNNHEFKLADTTKDSRVSIQEFISDFQDEMEKKRMSWSLEGLQGTYTFTYYNMEDSQNPITFEFTVE